MARGGIRWALYESISMTHLRWEGILFDLVYYGRVLTMREPMKCVEGLQDEMMLKTPLRILAMTALLVLAWMSY
jgi:hypothetical protein